MDSLVVRSLAVGSMGSLSLLVLVSVRSVLVSVRSVRMDGSVRMDSIDGIAVAGAVCVVLTVVFDCRQVVAVLVVVVAQGTIKLNCCSCRNV